MEEWSCLNHNIERCKRLSKYDRDSISLNFSFVVKQVVVSQITTLIFETIILYFLIKLSGRIPEDMPICKQVPFSHMSFSITKITGSSYASIPLRLFQTPVDVQQAKQIGSKSPQELIFFKDPYPKPYSWSGACACAHVSHVAHPFQ